MKKSKTFVPVQDFIRDHQQESDRGYILVASVILESALEYLLRKRMRQLAGIEKRNVDPLFSPSGPLSSFWAKLNLAYAMRVIPDWVYRDLEILRGIRNDSAHTYHPFSFTEHEVEGRIRQFRSPYRAAGQNNRYVTEERFKKEMQRLSSEEWKPYSEPKLRFAMMFHYVHGFLTEGRAYSNRRSPTKRTECNPGIAHSGNSTPIATRSSNRSWIAAADRYAGFH